MLNEQDHEKIKIGQSEYTAEDAKNMCVGIFSIGIIFIIVGVIVSIFLKSIGIIILIIGILNILYGLHCKKLIKNHKNNKQQKVSNQIVTNTEYQNVETNSPKSNDENMKNYCLFEDIEENENGKKQLLSYEYENNICLIDYDINKLSGNGGEDIRFVQEPENQYDNKAVAIYLNENKIGYVYKGQIQDMINDWIRKKYFFKGYINKIFLDQNKATYKIAFYKPLDLYESKTFSLIKTKQKIDDFIKREDNLECCDKGESVQLEYKEAFLSDKEALTVYTDCYEEIGELGKGAINYYNEHSDKKIVGIIDDLFYDDNENIKAKIKLFVTGKAK